MVPMGMSPEGVQRMMLTPKMLLSMHVLQLNIMDLRFFMRGHSDIETTMIYTHLVPEHLRNAVGKLEF